MRRISAVLTVMALGLAAGGAAAGPAWTNVGRNPHGYTLKVSGEGTPAAGVVFTISACPQAKCFHISGPLKLPSNEGGLNEGSFSIPTLDCEIHFLEVPRNGMDSADLRVSLIGSDQAGRGCASLPSGLPGLYRAGPPEA